MTSKQFRLRFKRGRKLVAFAALCALVIAVPLGIYFARQPQEAEAGWFSGSGSEGTWKFRRKISIDHAQVMGSSALTDFPLSLNTSFSELATHAQADGDDIVFTAADGTTKLSHELEYYAATTGKLTAWIKIPSLSTTQDTSFYMYYGNPNAANQESVTATWESNFMAVWHFGEDPGSGDFLDSTSNNNDCQTIDGTDSWASGDRVEGKLGYAVDFALESRYLNCGSNTVLDIIADENLSVIGWLKERDTDGTVKRALSKASSNPGSAYAGYQLQLRDDLGGNTAQFRVNDGEDSAEEVIGVGGSNTILSSQWEFISISLDRVAGPDVAATYQNAQYTDYVSSNRYDGSLATTNNLYINANHDASTTSYLWGGWDELWLYNNTLSEEFVQTLYFNQNEPNSFFSTFGEPEQNTDPIAWWKLDEGANNSCVSPDIQYVDTAVGAGNGTTVSIAKADLAGLSNNDLVVVALAHNEVAGAGGSWTLSGWTFVSQKTTIDGSDLNTAIAYKIITDVSSEAATWDFAVSASGDKSATAIALRGVNTSSPVDATVVAADGTNNNQPDAPDITTSSNGAMVVSTLHLIDPASIDMYASAPIGMVNAGGSNQNGADTAFTSMAFKEVPASGAYAIDVWRTDDVNATSEYHTNTIAFAKTSTKTGDVCDGTQEKLHGTNSGATWQSASSCALGSSCMLFDGSNDVVTVTNTESIDLNNQLATAFSVEFWVNPTSDGEANTGEIFNKGTSTYCRTTNDDATFVDLECSLDLAAAGSDATLTITDGLRLNTWQHVALTYTDDADDEITLYINGVYRGVSTNGSGSPETDTSNLLFGGGTSNNFHGYLDETKVFAYERSVEQIKSDYILGAASAGSSAAIGVGTTAMPTPAAHWKFDDMSGTTAQDAGSGNLDLTLSSASWTRSGKFGGAFNGTGGAVRASRADEANLQFAAADSFTLSAWVKSDTTTNPAAIEYILAQGATSSAGYALYFNTSGFACVAIDDDTSWGTPDTSACSSTDYYDGTWHHLVGVRNVGSDTLSLYVDGVQKASSTDTTTATLDSNGVTYVADMDADDAGSGEEFAGDIDEMKIYRSALTAAQIATDMNADSAANLGLGVNEQAAIADGDYQSTLVGYWPLDENVDNTCTGVINDVCDRSGSANDGPNNATPIWVSGKFGSALRYSAGSSQYTSIAGPSSVKTVSFWINPQDDTEPMLNVTSTSDYITSSAGAVSATGFSSPSIYVNGILNGSVQGSYWNHVVVASDTAENASDLYFGRANASYLTGSIDEVRLFSAKLTAAQVAHEYSRGEPVAWYRFDECTGATANDAAEIIPLPTLRPNSTITIGGTGTYTATGNCTSGTSTHAWYAGASGKYGSALALDGTNDYAVSPNAALVVPTSGTYSGVSWGAWVKPTSSVASKTIIHKNNEFRLTTNASSQPVCQIYASSWQTGATHSTALSLDTWSHVMCVYNGSTITTYIDGIASSTQAETDAITSTNTTALSVGRDSAGSGYVQGLLDEVRVYNYPLSPVQLQQVMAGGSTRFE